MYSNRIKSKLKIRDKSKWLKYVKYIQSTVKTLEIGSIISNESIHIKNRINGSNRSFKRSDHGDRFKKPIQIVHH